MLHKIPKFPLVPHIFESDCLKTAISDRFPISLSKFFKDFIIGFQPKNLASVVNADLFQIAYEGKCFVLSLFDVTIYFSLVCLIVRNHVHVSAILYSVVAFSKRIGFNCIKISSYFRFMSTSLLLMLKNQMNVFNWNVIGKIIHLCVHILEFYIQEALS